MSQQSCFLAVLPSLSGRGSKKAWLIFVKALRSKSLLTTWSAFLQVPQSLTSWKWALPCQESKLCPPQHQREEKRLQSSPVGLQAATSSWDSYSKISELPSALGQSWSLRTHQPVEISSQHMHPSAAGASGCTAGGGARWYCLFIPNSPLIKVPVSAVSLGCGIKLITRSAASPAMDTFPPQEVSPKAGLGRRQVPAVGQLGVRTLREQEQQQEHGYRWTASMGKEGRNFKPQTS